MEHLDIVAQLPEEITHKILLLLPGEDLISSSLVSKKWRSVTNKDSLWKRLCLLEDINLSSPIPPLTDEGALEPVCEFKRVYILHGSVLQKWRRNQFKTMDFQNVIGTGYFENETALAVAFWDGSIEVYDLSRTPRAVQSVPPMVPVGGLVSFAIGDDEHLVLRWNGAFLVYKWVRGCLEYLSAVYAVEEGRGRVGIRATASTDLANNVSGNDTLWEVKALVGDVLAIYVRQDSAIHFWSLEESRCTDVLSGVKSPSCRTYKRNLFVVSPDRVTVYNRRGERELFLGLERLGYNVRHVGLHFNPYVFVGVLNCSQGVSFIKVWDWALRQVAQIKVKLHGLVLHPKLPVAFYLSQFGRQRCQCSLTARDLRGGVVLWETPYPTEQPFGTIHEDFVFLSVVKEKYLLCIPRYDSSVTSTERLLFDVADGRLIYYVKNDVCFTVNHSNDNLIELVLYNFNNVHFSTRFMLFN